MERIDYDKKVVFAEGKYGQRYQQEYDKLILQPVLFLFHQILKEKELDNVQFVKLFQNAKDVIDKLHNNSLKDIVVVGQGISALNWQKHSAVSERMLP